MSDKSLSPMGQHIMDTLLAHGNAIRAGIQAEQERMRPAVRCLQRTYMETLCDCDAKVPSKLQLAVENLLRAWSEGITNEYSNAKVAADKHARHAGKPEHDMNTRGERMKAGA
jgi:hypothetical protein